MATEPVNTILPGTVPLPIPIQLIGQPCLRVQTPLADTTDVATLWGVMLSMVGVLNITQASTVPLGSALAAPQIGLSVRAFLVYNLPSAPGSYQFFINPTIAQPKNPTYWNSAPETCLSIPNNGSESWQTPNTSTSGASNAINAAINRLASFEFTYYTFFQGTDTSPYTLSTTPGPMPSNITIKKYTPGTNYSGTANQEENWVLQHELDHLNGILYTDYMGLGTSNNYYQINSPNSTTGWSPAGDVLAIAQQSGNPGTIVPVAVAPTYTCEINSSLPSTLLALTTEQAELALGNLTAQALIT